MFFVMHGLVMLMKQHSYAFYNGHLSTLFQTRELLLEKLRELERVMPSANPSTAAPAVSSVETSHLAVPPSAVQRRHSLTTQTQLKLQKAPDEEPVTDIDRIAEAIASRQALNDEQITTFDRIIKWEVDALADELQGTASDPSKAYPHNLGFVHHYKWIPLPTVVYEIEYPRSDSISWKYVVEKLVAMVGVLFVMNQVAQYSICKSPTRTIELFCHLTWNKILSS